MREIVLDVETTGLDVAEGHRVIEIGALELENRCRTGEVRQWYLNPEREIDEAAKQVHGITAESLSNKPLFHEIAGELLEFIGGATLVAHNASFDLTFLNNELRYHSGTDVQIEDICPVVDTLEIARGISPTNNSLDALCQRYGVDNSARDLHGALLDAELLAEVYVRMTGGQLTLFAEDDNTETDSPSPGAGSMHTEPEVRPPVLMASPEEISEHEKALDLLEKEAGECLWRRADWNTNDSVAHDRPGDG